MYYYSNRSRMSASAGWPGAGGQQSCCGGGGELINGNGGGEITEARALRDWESATCDSTNDKRSTSTRDREDSAGLGLPRCCRGGDDCAADGQDGGVRFPRCTGTTRTAAREVPSSDAAVSKRRACSYSRVSKRACFPETSAALHCGDSDPDSGTGTGSSDEAAGTQRRQGICSGGALGTGKMEATGCVINRKRRGCGTAKGRVRLCRIRSFLASTEGVSANGVPAAPLSDSKPYSQLGGACAGVTGDATGSWLKQVEAGKKQVQLEERTDMLWRRLHAVQVKQVQRHVTQQLVDLRRSSFTPNSAELLRLARSCSEALRTAGGALDSDNTASSSGGGSDSEQEEEEEEEEGRRGRHDSPSRVPMKLAENSPHTARTSSAARVRPLLPQCRPRLIRLHACPALGLRNMSLSRCCQPPAVCVLCSTPHPPVQETSTRGCRKAPEQRIHAILSMPSDFPSVVYGVAPPLARLQSHSAAKWMERQGLRKAGRVRRRILNPSPPGTLPSLFNSSGRSTCRSLRGVVRPGLLPHYAGDLHHLSGGTPDTPTQPMRRRRAESSFDINNLVMPLGSAGLQARVQKLHWRELDSSWEDLEKWMVSEGPHAPQKLNTEKAEHTGGVEDLSDAVFLKRHAVWESRERSRWGSRAHRRHRGRSSSSCGNGDSYRGSEQKPCCPGPRQRRSSLWRSFHYTTDESFHQTLNEQQSVLAWERRSFPLLKEELRWLQNDKEAELEEDVCAASGRSQSTDSGISEGSLELSPRTPHHISYTQEATNQLPQLRTQTPPCFL
ncbi:KAT8 regulatory NSL complex subunit 1 [Bagarius yarrelli]|uniref:KAT8 regulatory NSL complex subunit 1 n=1 Tax=Bagarius yarrelli TaxID=175774 RepID=A0A556VU18_BAGYA|nr:KAT8 regulatory NSL complex subunit 1 [Bagarius yarrelli]